MTRQLNVTVHVFTARESDAAGDEPRWRARVGWSTAIRSTDVETCEVVSPTFNSLTGLFLAVTRVILEFALVRRTAPAEWCGWINQRAGGSC